MGANLNCWLQGAGGLMSYLLVLKYLYRVCCLLLWRCSASTSIVAMAIHLVFCCCVSLNNSGSGTVKYWFPGMVATPCLCTFVISSLSLASFISRLFSSPLCSRSFQADHTVFTYSLIDHCAWHDHFSLLPGFSCSAASAQRLDTTP